MIAGDIVAQLQELQSNLANKISGCNNTVISPYFPPQKLRPINKKDRLNFQFFL